MAADPEIMAAMVVPVTMTEDLASHLVATNVNRKGTLRVIAPSPRLKTITKEVIEVVI